MSEVITQSGSIFEVQKNQTLKMTSEVIRERQIDENQWAYVASCVIVNELPAILVDDNGVESNRVQKVVGDLILSRD